MGRAPWYSTLETMMGSSGGGAWRGACVTCWAP
ncbi:Uncharacterised protein [Bordetella pertussis]|nr:Uncharacterised protein [Bordetella pertussis]CPP05669.1 Uncharacterised protein [Bordetella pertussis]